MSTQLGDIMGMNPQVNAKGLVKYKYGKLIGETLRING